MSMIEFLLNLICLLNIHWWEISIPDEYTSKKFKKKYRGKPYRVNRECKQCNTKQYQIRFLRVKSNHKWINY